MKRIGITGPTGAGKTTVLNALRELGVQIFDADAVYHSLLARNTALRDALVQRFGTGILENGHVSRRKLGEVVFPDPDALAELNQITHRFVLEEIDRQMLQAEEQGARAAALDAIALFESGAAELCDATVAVLAPKELRIARIMQRDNIPEEYARKRADAQQDDAFFRARCDCILENDGSEPEEIFQRRARQALEQFL